MNVDYASTLFEKSIGFTTQTAALMSGFLNTWFFVASFIPWFLIDRVGRKPLVGGYQSYDATSSLANQILHFLAHFDDKRDGCNHGCSVRAYLSS